jgi:hypothetical protein
MMIVTQPVVIDLVREGEDFTDAIQALDLLFATFAVRVEEPRMISPLQVELLYDCVGEEQADRLLKMLRSIQSRDLHRALAQFRTLARSSEDKGGRQ